MVSSFSTDTDTVLAPAVRGERPATKALRLNAGDWVEVRSAAEIMATLDENGRLGGLPFMPEMLQYCGRRYRVFKSAHKTCDTIKSYRSRSMADAVHLEDLRCDGAAHGGCQARCLLFWNTAWLKPAARKGPPVTEGEVLADCPAVLTKATRAGADRELYSCQATALLDATQPLDWRDPKPYLRDLTSRNIGIFTFLRYVGLAAFRAAWRRISKNYNYPSLPGRGPDREPAPPLNLQPGEKVRVRSRDDIYRTLSPGRKTRGLWFDVEMEPFCGKTCTVVARVDRIVDEKTGRMIHLASDCIILKETVCNGCRSRDRLFCPRQLYPYWREAWLKRVS